jgi:glycosyltransferase involved in cell wall biosynthesis
MGYLILFIFLCSLYLSIIYFLGLFYKFPNGSGVSSENSIVIIPARNEEKIIGIAINSIRKVFKNIYVVANNCNDNTAGVGFSNGANVLKIDGNFKNGKDSAIRWALSELSKRYDNFNYFVFDSDVILTKDFKNVFRYLGNDIATFPFKVYNSDNILARLSGLISVYTFRFAKGFDKLFKSSFLNGVGFFIPSGKVNEFIKFESKTKTEDFERSLFFKVRFVDVDGVYTLLPNNLKSLFYQRLRWFASWYEIPIYYTKQLFKRIEFLPLFIMFYYSIVYMLLLFLYPINLVYYLFTGLIYINRYDNNKFYDYLILPFYIIVLQFLGFLSAFINIDWVSQRNLDKKGGILNEKV